MATAMVETPRPSAGTGTEQTDAVFGNRVGLRTAVVETPRWGVSAVGHFPGGDVPLETFHRNVSTVDNLCVHTSWAPPLDKPTAFAII